MAAIKAMQLKLTELQDSNVKVKKIQSKDSSKRWEDIQGVLHHQDLLYVLEIIKSKVINYHHDDLLPSYFGINKTRKLVAKKYFLPTFCQDVEAYVKDYNFSLTSKIVYYKPYGDLQLLQIPTHCWQYLSIDFVKGLLLLVGQKSNSYDAILVIVD